MASPTFFPLTPKWPSAKKVKFPVASQFLCTLDVSRAACILRELLLLSSDDSDKDMRPLEAAIDTLLSPLFRSLVDICNKNKVKVFLILSKDLFLQEMMSNIDSNNPIDHAFDFTSINSAPSSKSNTTTGKQKQFIFTYFHEILGSSSQRELHQVTEITCCF